MEHQIPLWRQESDKDEARRSKTHTHHLAKGIAWNTHLQSTFVDLIESVPCQAHSAHIFGSLHVLLKETQHSQKQLRITSIYDYDLFYSDENNGLCVLVTPSI